MAKERISDELKKRISITISPEVLEHIEEDRKIGKIRTISKYINDHFEEKFRIKKQKGGQKK